MGMKTDANTKLTATEIAIATHAIGMLSAWSWSKGEPLAALSLASRELFGKELHQELARIGNAERMYAACGSIANNAEARLTSLRAVVRFHS